MTVGKSIPRVDAYAKVTGQAKYTEDLLPAGYLTAMLLRSTVANGLVRRIDTADALRTEGIVRIVTCFDVPEIDFPTAGHPWSTEGGHQDVADRRLLNRRVRYYGDEIAAVIGRDVLACREALDRIEVEYEEYPPILSTEAAMAKGAGAIHEEYPDNILKETDYAYGAFDWDDPGEGIRIIEGDYHTQAVQHCHVEKPVSFAYMENDRITVVSSTQIPHIVRRVVGQALGVGWGRIRVVKPYIGGGFGNKQEVLYEPLNAYLTTMVGGRCVLMALSREETFYATRTRHSIDMHLKSAVDGEGRFLARQVTAVSNQGGYASHGHSIVANTVTGFRQLYDAEKLTEGKAYTVYTNLPSGGAMRGYGIPQINFAMESHADDIAVALGMDPAVFRQKNAMKLGYVDPGTNIACHSTGLAECIEKGKTLINWEEKRKTYGNQTGILRRGVGMAIFSYKTGVYPISLETSSCRMILNQDGSAQLHMGATEIGQGGDTVFTQMAAEASGLRFEDIHIVSFQDTDVAPFDTGAYASRQTYVGGKAILKTGALFKDKILTYGADLLHLSKENLDLKESRIIHRRTGNTISELAPLALEAFYSLKDSVHITAEATSDCKENTFSFGACFAEVEVDIPLGKVKVLEFYDIHDSGRLINPQLAEAQVQGGMSMGLGYALSEQMLYDEKGRLLNGNFLDYKIGTSMDTPELKVDFVETYDPTGPFGNKALGEPPTIPQSAALRNAIFQATGVALNRIPMSPQRLTEAFAEAGISKNY